jgi:hypothetical protein
MPKPSHAVERKLHELEQEAEAGESPKTPLILIGTMQVVAAIAVLVVLGLVLLAVRLYA